MWIDSDRPLLPVGRVGLERLHRDVVQHGFARRRQDDGRRSVGVSGFEPATEAETPAVAGLKPRELQFGSRSDQVVALRLAVLQELRRDDRADLVATAVATQVSAVAVPQIPRRRVAPADLEWFAVDVSRSIVGVAGHDYDVCGT